MKLKVFTAVSRGLLFNHAVNGALLNTVSP